MTTFVVLAALLLLLALCVVLPALLRLQLVPPGADPVRSTPPGRPQPRLAVGLSVALVLAAVLVYASVGTPASLQATQAAETVSELVEHLTTRPGDAAAWRRLVRAYESAQRFKEAVEAYRQLVKLSPGDADILLDYAVTLAMSGNQQLVGEPEQLIQQALTLAPQNVQALALAGSVRFERQDYAGAVALWRQVLLHAPADSPVAQGITDNIAKAESLAGRAKAGARPDAK